MMNHYRKFLALTLSLAVSGCGYIDSFSHIEKGHNPGLPSGGSNFHLIPAAGTEFVASSGQNQRSVNGTHLISSSLGSLASGVVLKTAGGKTLYSNVQGELVSP